MAENAFHSNDVKTISETVPLCRTDRDIEGGPFNNAKMSQFTFWDLQENLGFLTSYEAVWIFGRHLR